MDSKLERGDLSLNESVFALWRSKLNMKNISVIFVILLLAGAAFAQTAHRDEVLRAEKALGEALIKGDAAALDRLLASDLIFTHANAVVEGKNVLLGNIKSGALKYELVELEDTTVNLYKKAAVVGCKIRLRGVAGGQPFSVYAALTHVWVKQKGAWKLVAHHATLVPQGV